MRAYSLIIAGAVMSNSAKLARVPTMMLPIPITKQITTDLLKEKATSFLKRAMSKQKKLAARNKSLRLVCCQKRVGFLNNNVRSDAKRSRVAILSQEGILGEYFI